MSAAPACGAVVADVRAESPDGGVWLGEKKINILLDATFQGICRFEGLRSWSPGGHRP
jgi:hypothetical protein